MYYIDTCKMTDVENTFSDMLKYIFSNPKQEVFAERGFAVSIYRVDDDRSMEVKQKFLSYLDPEVKPELFILSDKNGLSILGYSLLTGKSLVVSTLFDFLCRTHAPKVIEDFVLIALNRELKFILTHRVNYPITTILNKSYEDELAENILRIMKCFPSFRLSDENVQLLARRMLIAKFNSLNKSKIDIGLRDNTQIFEIPERFIRVGPPPGPPPSHGAPPLAPPPPGPPHSGYGAPPPPPPNYVAPPPSHGVYGAPPPPPSYGAPPPPGAPPSHPPIYGAPPGPHSPGRGYGGTRKHKRQNKQMRKNISKKK